MTTEFSVTEHRLDNGLRVVCETMPRVRSAAVGFFVCTGSRHETRANEHGVSHFLEHMCFKGTAKRGWQDITIRFDELGSIYNAFTSKEHTVYYGWTPAARLEPQIELLADMMRPSLPVDEFETERKVILEEIAMSGDSFEHHVSNFLHEIAFKGHPLAHEILGEHEAVAALPRDTMAAYHASHYSPENMYLVASGAVQPDEVRRIAERYCGNWKSPQRNGGYPAPPALPTGVFKHKLEQFKQQSILLVYPSVQHGHDDSENIEAFTSLFGGANSRCYWNIVQKGICAAAGAVWLAYKDCGLLALYADGEPDKCDEMLAALKAQAAEVVAGGFRLDEVQRVKNQRRTQLALEGENPRTRLMQIVDDLEGHGEVRSPTQRLADVEAVTPETIAEYLARFPITGDGLMISCGPRDWPA